MLDINIEAEKALSELECRVVYQYPGQFTDVPVVSYYNITEKCGFSADNIECIQDGHVQVDVWCETGMECGKLSVKINDVMTRNGWVREMSRDVPEKNEKIYHRTMRFQKYFTL